MPHLEQGAREAFIVADHDMLHATSRTRGACEVSIAADPIARCCMPHLKRERPMRLSLRPIATCCMPHLKQGAREAFIAAELITTCCMPHLKQGAREAFIADDRDPHLGRGAR